MARGVQILNSLVEGMNKRVENLKNVRKANAKLEQDKIKFELDVKKKKVEIEILENDPRNDPDAVASKKELQELENKQKKTEYEFKAKQQKDFEKNETQKLKNEAYQVKTFKELYDSQKEQALEGNAAVTFKDGAVTGFKQKTTSSAAKTQQFDDDFKQAIQAVEQDPSSADEIKNTLRKKYPTKWKTQIEQNFDEIADGISDKASLEKPPKPPNSKKSQAEWDRAWEQSTEEQKRVFLNKLNSRR